MNPDYITIKDYLAGKLDARVAHELEKRALDDPFLADAIEGYRSAHAPSDHQLSILQRQLEERIAIQQENKNRFNFNTQRLSIAAAAGLLFITAGLLFWMKMPHSSEQAAQSKKVDVELTPRAPADNISKTKVDPIPPQVASTLHPAVSPGRSAENIGAAVPVMAEDKSARVVPVMTLSKAAVPTFTGGAITTFRGNPLPGVAVGIKGSSATTFTDENGQFSLPGNTKGTVILAAVGYQTVELSINPGDRLLVTMKEDQNALNEIVVSTGDERSPRPLAYSINVVQPKGGRAAFDQYVSKNIQYPAGAEKITGEVILSFAINNQGRPENIRIVKGLGTAYDNEAIRVLKAGPEWELNGVNASSETQVSIKFKPY